MSEVMIVFFKFYKKIISPVFEGMFGKACRFTPSCSTYTITSLERFGLGKGLYLGLKRFLRCHPWGGSGFDPVPEI